MTKFDSVRTCKGDPRGRRVRVLGRTISVTLSSWSILVATLSLVFSSALYAQSENEVVEFDIPASTLPQALRTFARQSRIELVFAERGYDDVMTQAVVGSYQRERALEMLLAGTGLSVGFGSGDSVIVQRARPSSEASTRLSVGRVGDEEILMAQAAVAESMGAMQGGAISGSADQTFTSSGRGGIEGESQATDEITVTGSRIRGAQSASPLVTIDRAEIDMAGFATVEEVVEYLPQNFGAGASSDADLNNINEVDIVGGNVSNVAGGTSVNLRGLGTNSTLVLLNGRRMSPSGFTSGFTNIGSIPVTAIERVEVLTDGASAIYGSDAIAGVINFILREDYEGAETRLRYGSDSGGDTADIRLGQTFGMAWNSGSALLTYEYFDREALASSDRAYTSSSDLTPFGGTDWRQAGGSPGNIIAGGQSFAIPDGQDGTALTPADFLGLGNTQNFFNERAVIDLMPDLERHSAFLHVTQDAGGVELFASARISQEENARRSSTLTIYDFTVTDASPYFVDPTNSGLTEVTVSNYSISEEVSPILSIGEIDSFGATLGAQVDLTEGWSAELSFDWSREEALAGRSGLNTDERAALTASVNNSDPALAFNPFGDGSNTNNRAILEQLVSPFLPQTSYDNELRSAGVDIDGRLFQLGGGTAKLAAGFNFRRESLSTVTGLSGTRREEDLDRDVRAVYAEVFLPVVGRSNSRPGLRRFEVSLAARHEDFSDFGSSTNPKLGVLWSPVESLAVRGTIGTSYRAPALADLNDLRSSIFFLPATFFGQSFIVGTGQNSDLGPEESTTWTAGIQWTPDSIDGLSLDATYFNVDFTGRITIPLPSIIPAVIDPAGFPSIVITDPTPEQISQFVNRSNFEEGRFAPGSPEDFVSGAIPIDFIVDNRLTNLAESEVTGLELQLSYTSDTDLGTISAGLNGNYLFDFKRRLLPTDPFLDEVDTYGRPVDFRARGNLGLRRNNWSFFGFVTYTDGYTDNASGPDRPDDPRAVDSWTTVDLSIGYSVSSGSGFLSDTRFSLTAQNLFDEDPPFVDTRGGIGYDAVNANPLGRFFAFQVTKDW